MTIKVMTQPWLWKRFTTNAIDSYTGGQDEPIIDLRGDRPKLKICDTLTPGGVEIGATISAGISTPRIVSPTNGATLVDKSPIITSTQFEGMTVDLESDNHAGTLWQVATDVDFTNIVHDSGWSAIHLTEYDLANAGVTLANDTVHYMRIKHRGASGNESSFSPVTSVTVTTMLPTQQTATIRPSVEYGFIWGEPSMAADGKRIAVGGGVLDADPDPGVVLIYDFENGIWNETVINNPNTDKYQYSGAFGRAVCLSPDGGMLFVKTLATSNYVYILVYAFENNLWTLKLEIELDDMVREISGNLFTAGHTGADAQYMAASNNGDYLTFDIDSNEGNDYKVGVIEKYIDNNGDIQYSGLAYDRGNDNDDSPGTGGGSWLYGHSQAISADGHYYVTSDPYLDIIHEDGHIDQNVGKIYIHSMISGGTRGEGKYFPSDKDVGREFGLDLAMSEDGKYVAVGAPGRTGAFYIFENEDGEGNYIEIDKVQLDEYYDAGEFGSQIDMSADGSVVYVGSKYHNNNGVEALNTYVFKKSNGNWIQHAILLPDNLDDLNFGHYISLSASGHVAAAWGDGVGSSEYGSGAIYIFSQM